MSEDSAASAKDDDQSAVEPTDPTGPQPEVETDRQVQPVDQERPPRLPFPVVGIGASAGGLEAMFEFLTAVPPDSGMAYVFIQHLPPEHHSMLADILSKKTKMPVLPVEDGMEVKADHLYVIRPGHVLTIKGGRLHLGAQTERRGTTRPVDDFFKSLAEEQRERAIGVILSGMGSNGTAGAQALKAVGGLCVAQDPDDAQFPSMPRHLIDQGYADYILRPADMPDVLLQYAGHPYAREGRQNADEQLQRNANHLREILAILRTRTRQDFSGYKKPTLLRRIQRRMGLARLTEIGEYARHLRQSPAEVTALSDDLLIHVTGFFRDREAWDAMRQRVIVPLVARVDPGSEVRAWVTACSSGEEAYTLAMLLVEEAERANKPLAIKVFATDMAERTLDQARGGVYPGGIEAEIDPERLARFFETDDGVYRVRPHLRECVVFAPQNVLQDPPFSRLDIVSCRNLLIYLEPAMQQRVLSLLHFGLREGGVLFLGGSETAAGMEDRYEVVDKRARIFRRVGPTRYGQPDFPLPHAIRRAGPAGNGEGREDAGAPAAGAREAFLMGRRVTGRPSISVITQRTLLEQHVRAAVAIDREHRVLYYHGNTRPFLEQLEGEPTRDLLALARQGLRASVRVALHRCAAQQAAVTVLDGWVQTGPGLQARVAVTASPAVGDDPARPEYFVVSFDQLDDLHVGGGGDRGSRDGGAPGDGEGADGATDAQAELRRMREELQSTIQELQISNEELKASNQEITSFNEEFQSSNEELETSKEEMQSLNEELTTVNAQLQAKIEEHQSARNDLMALLSSTAIAVLFLDSNFRIRRFTPALSDLMDLIPVDVGRPLKDLHRKFDDPHLDEDVRSVLEKLVPVEREVPAASGRHYVRRALPYRTVDHRIEGVVVTFVDVTDRRQAERERAALRELAEKTVETLHEPLLVLRANLTIDSANSAFYRDFKVTPEETHGRMIYDLGNGQWDIPALRTALEEVLPAQKAFDDFEVTHDFQGMGRRVMLLNGRQLDHQQLILLGIRDITARHDAEAALRGSEERFRTLVQNLHDYSILMTDAQGVITQWSEGAQRVTGFAAAEAVGKPVSQLYTPEQVQGGYVQREFSEAAETGRAEREDWRLRKNGERFWCNEVVTAVRDVRGRLTAFAKISRDLTDRKRAEAAVREGDERFRLVFDGARDFAMIMLDPDSRITAWNAGAERIIGFGRDEAIGLDGAILFTPEDRLAGEHEKELATARAKGSAMDERWHQRKDGTVFWGSGVMTALKNPDGMLRGYVKVLRDESARKEAEDALQGAKAAAEEANRTKNEFLANLSHELRTPLSAVLLWSKILTDQMTAGGSVDARQLGEGLQAIRTSGEAQKELIEDLLDVSRITSGTLRLQLREVELRSLVGNAVDAIAPTAETKGVALTVDLGKDGLAVRADPERLRQVIWNLLSNAVKFTPAGRTVTVTLARRPNEIEFRVADNGRGISAAFLPHVFERFRQADPSSTRTEGGLGLGLAITKQLVELHGGSISAESPGLNQGATFVVRLPTTKARPGGGGSVLTAVQAAFARKTAAPAAAEDVTADADGDEPTLEGHAVLVVEDDRAARQAIVRVLEAVGMTVREAESAAAALAVLREGRVNVLVINDAIREPGGAPLIRAVRALEANAGQPATPALALTAERSPGGQRQALESGFQQAVTKPVDPDAVLAALREIVAQP